MKEKHCKRKVLFWTDLFLIPCFVATALTGIGMHFAGHHEPHEIWEIWALAHVISSILWLVSGIYHIYRHWAWYKSLFVRTSASKSKVTLLLSIVFLVIVITGILLLAVINGPNSHIGILHFWLGIFLVVLSLLHIIMRWRTLMKLRK